MVPIDSPLVVFDMTSIVSNIASLTAFAIFDVQFCDLDLGQFKAVQTCFRMLVVLDICC